MINLTGTNIPNLQNSGFHIDSKLVAIYGIDIFASNNIKDTISSSVSTSTTTIIASEDWTGYVGFVTIDDEILYVTSANNISLTVIRGQYGTLSTTHSVGSKIYTIAIFPNVLSYEWNQSIGLSDRDLFSTEISSGKITLDDAPKNWNKLYDGCLYSFKRNKEVFIWEGCNGELVKVWEGLTTNKTSESYENVITIEMSDYFVKYADEPIRPVAVFNDIRPKELLESLFDGFTAEYVGNTDFNDYFKINNLCTVDFSTYRDFLNYICKEYAIRILFRKDKKIHILSDMYPSKINPIANIETELTKINDDSSGDIIINSISGTYKERKALKDTSYTPIRFRKSKVFTSTINILQSGVFQSITLTNLSYDNISTMTYQEYQMIQSTSTGNTYFCKLADIVKIAPNNYTITLYAGIDKVSKWNELGRVILEGNISITNFTLYWSYDELPIIWKYEQQIDNTDTTSNLMIPLFPLEDFTFYINKFGVGDTSSGKFSGIVSGFETLLNQEFTNTQLFYNQEYKQNTTVPIYLYTNKIATNVGSFPNCNDVICIGSIDNSNVTLKLEYSDIIVKSSSTNNVVKFENSSNDNTGIYKGTVKNTLTNSGTLNITPISTLAGQRILKLSLSDYNTCNVGDALKLLEIDSSDVKYSTYLGFQNARYLITSKFSSGGEYFITLNDYYPIAVGTEYTFVKYNRADIILLNELYFRANPIMESEISYDYTNSQSVEEYGTKNYTLEGKSLIKDDFLKVIAYVKDTYNGITESGIRNKLRTEMIKRLDLEAGDVVTVTDSIYTKYDNQKVLITNKRVSLDTNGERTESYEMITIGDYSISPDTLGLKNVISWSPDVPPTYNHYGTEGETEQKQDSEIDNKRIVLQDLTEGQIYLEEISQSVFYGTTSLSSVITSDIKTFELGISSTATGTYWDNLFSLDTEGVIKINSEYLSYKSLGYTTNLANVQIISRGLGNSKIGDITSNIRIQFYKTIAKISAKGMKSTDLSLGDGTNNYIEVHSDTGVEIKSTKKVRMSNLYNDLFFDDTDNSSYIYINNNKIKLGKNAISAGKDGFLLTKDANNYLSYNVTDSTFDLKTQNGYIGSSANHFDISNSLIYLNNGSQQIGANIFDFSGGTPNTPYDGFFFGDKNILNNKYIKYNGTDLTIKTNKGVIGSISNYFDITNEQISLVSGAIKLGKNAISGTSDGIYIGASGKLRINSTDTTLTTLLYVGSGTNYLKYDTLTGLSVMGNIDISGGSINLTTTDTYNQLYFDPTHSIIKLNTNDTSTNWGLQIGKNTSSTNYFNFDSSGLIIKSNNINLYKDANNFLTLNSTTSSISLYQSATNKFTFDLTNGVEIITSKGKIGSTATYFDITNNSIVLGTDGVISIGSGANLFSWDNTNGLILKSTKIIDLSNTNNALYFDPASSGDNSYFRMNNNKIKIGKDAIATGDNGFYIFNDSNNYFKYSITNNLFEVKTQKGYIGNTNSYFDITNKSIVLGTEGSLTIGSSSNTLTWTNTDGLIIKTNKIVDIQNTNNKLYFDNTGYSYLRMNSNAQQVGRVTGLTGKSDFDGIFIGNTTIVNNKYFYYDGTDLQIRTDKGYIGGSLATSTYFDITNGSFQLYKSATDNLSFTTAGGLILKSSNVTVNTSSDNNYINLIPTSSTLYLGKNGTNIDVQIGSTSGNYITFLNGALDIKTTKLNISDTSNASLISLNSGKEQIGTGITLSGWSSYNGLFFGDTTVANENYIKYDIGNSRFTFGDNVQIAGVMKTGDTIKVIDVSAKTIVKYGELENGAFGFDYTSPTDSTNEYFRLSDATTTNYTQGLLLKTKGTVNISNTNNSFYFESGTSNNSYIRMNNNSQQIGRVTGITTKADFNGIFVGNTTLSNNKYFYYDGTSLAIAGNISMQSGSTINGTDSSTVVTNASNGNTAFNGTTAYRTDSAPTNNATFGTITTGVATEDGNVIINIPYTYTQGSLKADSIIIYVREGGGTVLNTDVAYITNAVSGSMKFVLKPNTIYSFGLQAVRKTESGLNGTTILSSSNITTIAGNYTAKIQSTNTSNYLSQGTTLKLGQNAISSGKDGFYVGGASSYISINTTDDEVKIKSTNIVDISNTNNSLYFDPASSGNNSYLRMNNNSIKLGKDAITTGKHGLNIYKDSNNYFQYNTTDSSLDFKGQYFNNIAYVYNGIDFVGALNTGSQYIYTYDSSGNPTIQNLNIYYGKTINEIIICSQIDITNISQSAFSGFVSLEFPPGYIRISSNISKISARQNYGITMGTVDGVETNTNKNWGLGISFYDRSSGNMILFENVSFGNLYKPIRNTSDADIHFKYCEFRLYLGGFIDGGNSENFTLNNIAIYIEDRLEVSKVSYIKNSSNIKIYLQDFYSESGFDTSSIGVFQYCDKINNVKIFGQGGSNTLQARIFINCDNISDIVSEYKIAVLFQSCNRVNLARIFYAPYTSNLAKISYCENMSNIYIYNITGTDKVIEHSNYISNCNFDGAISSQIIALTHDRGNSWNDKVTTKTTAYTILRDDLILNSNHSSAVVYTLPLANNYHENRIYTIKDVSGNAKVNNITIQRQGSNYIDGATSFTINVNYGSVSFYSDGTTWRRLISPTIFGY